MAVARFSSGGVAICYYASGGYMDDAMFAHNDQEYSTRRGRILKVIQKGAARI